MSTSMFAGCNKLKGGNGNTLADVGKTDKTYAFPDGLDGKKGLFTFIKEVYTSFDESTETLTYYYDEKRTTRPVAERYDYLNEMRFDWYNTKVKKAVINASMADAELTSMKLLFCGWNDDFENRHLKNMTAIEGLEYLNTVNVTDMSCMFSGCKALQSLDLSKFNTDKVTDMSYMFFDCKALTSLDLSKFNTDNVTDMNYMFYGCPALTTIYCSDDWSKGSVTDHTYMFKDCTSLKGVNGTTYDAGKIDIEYARPDGVDGKKGYFTEAKTFAVRFKDWDGTILKREDVLNGQSATAPKDPTRDGYIFLGWDEDFTCVTKDLIVTAMYQRSDDAVEQTEADNAASRGQKVFIDGTLYILMPDGTMYDRHARHGGKITL